VAPHFSYTVVADARWASGSHLPTQPLAMSITFTYLTYRMETTFLIDRLDDCLMLYL